MRNCRTHLEQELFEARKALIAEQESDLQDKDAIAELKAWINRLKRSLAEVEMAAAQRD